MSCVPAEALAGETGTKPDLFVELSQRRFARDDLGLDLDHEQRSGRPVPGQDIDRAVLPIHRIRHFDHDGPSGSAKHLCYQRHDGSVVLIEEPLQLTTSPPQIESKARFNGSCDSEQRRVREAITVAALDDGDGVVGDAGDSGQVGLAPTLSTAQGADDDAEADEVHVPRIVGAASLALIRRSGATAATVTLEPQLGQTTDERASEVQQRWQR